MSSAILNARRMTSLAAVRASNARGKSQLAPLIRSYVAPFFEMASGGDQGWRNYATLMERLANSPRGTDVISRHYDVTARAYIDAFRVAVPGASEQVVVDGFMVMVSAMLAVCAGTGRAERLMDNASGPALADATFDDLVHFMEAGFSAITRQSQTAPLRKAKR